MTRILLWVALWLAMAGGAIAQTVTDRVLAALQAQGYEVVQVSRTWLGRIWVIAESDEIRRELVFHPATGEILRDYAVALASLDPPDTRSTNRDRDRPTATVAATVTAADPLSDPAGVAEDPAPQALADDAGDGFALPEVIVTGDP